MLEKARGERFIGSALEAKVLLHVADAELAQSLQGLQGVCPNLHYQQAFQARHISREGQVWDRECCMTSGHGGQFGM